MRAVVLVKEGDSLARWEKDALAEAIDRGLEVVVVAHCADPPSGGRSLLAFGHGALVRTAHRRVPSTASVDLKPLIGRHARHLWFQPVHEGSLHRIPAAVAAQFRGADVVVNYGMSELYVGDLPVTHGVLSYRGDPARYRAHPGSFYELLHGAVTQRVTVELLSDEPSRNRIMAQATTRVVPHSYRKTLEGAHRSGVPLLSKALAALTSGDHERCDCPLSSDRQLPQPEPALWHGVSLWKRKAVRMLDALLTEKCWRTGFAAAGIGPSEENVLRSRDISEIPMPGGTAFAADPFYKEPGEVFAELMDRWTGLGEIGRWDGSRWQKRFLELPGHASYPQVVRSEDGVFVFPEITSSSPPMLFPADAPGQTLADGLPLKGLEGERIVDGTLHHDGETWYLFGGRGRDAEYRLDLWTASFLLGPYVPHPSSPICLDVRGARMAGPLLRFDGVFHRVGQDCSEGYGRAIRIHRIDRLSRTHYEEVPSGRISIDGAAGPHTVSVTPAGLLVDYYVERAVPLAGYRRTAAIVRRRWMSRRSAGLGARAVSATLRHRGGTSTGTDQAVRL